MLITYVIITFVITAVTCLWDKDELGQNSTEFISNIFAIIASSAVISVMVFLLSTIAVGIFAPDETVVTSELTVPFEISKTNDGYCIEWLQETDYGTQVKSKQLFEEYTYFNVSDTSKVETFKRQKQDGWWNVFSQVKWEETSHYTVCLPQDKIDELLKGNK